MILPQKLETKHLILRPHRKEDFDGFFATITDQTATKFLRFSPEDRTEEGSRVFFEEILATMDTPTPIFGLALIEKETEEYVGLLGLSSLGDGSGTESFYLLRPKFWKKGYATEAVKAVFEYAFSILNLDKIVTFVPEGSQAPARLAEKLGMEKIGREQNDEFLAPVIRYVATN